MSTDADDRRRRWWVRPAVNVALIVGVGALLHYDHGFLAFLLFMWAFL
jgi:hypothetical protein